MSDVERDTRARRPPSSRWWTTTHPGTIVARDFSFCYGEKQALFDVNLRRFPPRAVTALIGPSGCGKSTFLRSINRMNALIPGARHTGGDPARRSGHLRARAPTSSRSVSGSGWCSSAGIRSRSRSTTTSPTGRASTATTSRADLDEIVETSLRRAALWDEVKDRLRQSALGLSGGQQQRLCIARALANDPEVLLLDEPASALDPIATQKVEELLYELKRELTIVIVTHNMQQAARVSDCTAFFYLGRLVEVNATDRLFTSPREERTEAYITGRFG